MKITPKMRQVLLAADLDIGEVNDVPMSTMAGLERRQLVTEDWRKPINTSVSTTAGAFPHFRKVKLTETGKEYALTLQRHHRGDA